MIFVVNKPYRPRPLAAMVALCRRSVVKRLGVAWVGLMVGLLLASGAQAQQVSWIQAVNGQVPPGAVATGIERGANLYVCRVTQSDGSKHPGKLIVNDGCHIGYGGRELNLKSYEVMVGSVNWVASSQGRAVPAGAVIAGVERGTNLYVCRSTMSAGSVHGGKLMGTDTCHVGYGGREYPQTSFEVAVTAVAPPAPVAVVAAPAPVAITGQGNVMAKHSGRCLDVYTGSKDNNIDIVQWDCGPQDNQKFSYVDKGGGYGNLVAKHSGK